VNATQFHATVKKLNGTWAFRVYGKWDTGHPVLVARGGDRNWRVAVTQAARSVSKFRAAYARHQRAVENRAQ
jgi:hypothetical protein